MIDYVDDPPIDGYEDAEQVKRALAESVTRDEQRLRDRQIAYQRVFGNPQLAGEIALVMEDLKRFCRVERSTFHADQRVHALQEGRREVALRIMDHINLRFDVLFEKYTTGGQ